MYVGKLQHLGETKDLMNVLISFPLSKITKRQKTLNYLILCMTGIFFCVCENVPNNNTIEVVRCVTKNILSLM
jgi:hypothetical protein